jgi:CheY-like chemotaxis protein
MSHVPRTRTLVLVVDDDADVRGSVRILLESKGYLVSVAGSAGEALGEVRSQRPDVILTDIYMPLGDGYELISALRSLRDDIPVIAMSGGPAITSLPNQLAMASRMGATDTIQKPFVSAELVAVIERVVHGRPCLRT